MNKILEPGAIPEISKNNFHENLILFGILVIISKFSQVETKKHFLLIIILTDFIKNFSEENHIKAFRYIS